MVATQFHFFPPRLVFGRQSSNRLIKFMPQSWAGQGSSFWLLFLIISSQARHKWSHAGSSCFLRWSSPCSSSNVRLSLSTEPHICYRTLSCIVECRYQKRGDDSRFFSLWRRKCTGRPGAFPTSWSLNASKRAFGVFRHPHSFLVRIRSSPHNLFFTHIFSGISSCGYVVLLRWGWGWAEFDVYCFEIVRDCLGPVDSYFPTSAIGITPCLCLSFHAHQFYLQRKEASHEFKFCIPTIFRTSATFLS